MEQQGKIKQEKNRKTGCQKTVKLIKFSYGSPGEKSKPRNRLKLVFLDKYKTRLKSNGSTRKNQIGKLHI